MKITTAELLHELVGRFIPSTHFPSLSFDAMCTYMAIDKEEYRSGFFEYTFNDKSKLRTNKRDFWLPRKKEVKK